MIGDDPRYRGEGAHSDDMCRSCWVWSYYLTAVIGIIGASSVCFLRGLRVAYRHLTMLLSRSLALWVLFPLSWMELRARE